MKNKQDINQDVTDSRELAVSNNAKVLLALAAIMTIVLLTSNFLAAKIWNLFGIPVDGGLLLFPVSYVVGDILAELYGRKIANTVAALTALLNGLAILLLWVAVFLPPFESWEGQTAYAYIFTASFRVTVGSLASFLLSQITNNYAFLYIKKWQLGHGNPRGYKMRAIGSSVVGRLVDILIFETVAFLNVLPLRDFIKQAIGAYFEGIIVEVIMVLLVSEIILKILKNYIAKDSLENLLG